MSTEKTPLTYSAARTALNYPYYGNDTGTHQFYTRRRKEQQLQCITFVIIIAIFIMALVITVSYSINKADPLVADSTNPEVVPPSPSLKATWSPAGGSTETYSTSLTPQEWTEATKAGSEAISSRKAADALATPLTSPSPDSRHQYAVKTSLQAGKLALGGIGELAATRTIEKSRAKLGAPSSVGSYFKNIWIPDDACREFTKIVCPPSKYRNFDGTCNHPRNLGASLSPFVRKLPPAYADGVDAPRIGKFGRTLPSAREISLKVHPPAPSANPSFTVMLAVFGQFLDHDITATAISQGTNGSSLSCCPAATHPHPECFPVEVGPGDPVYDVAGRDCMEFVRSAPAPQCKIGPREQLNQVTAFIDASVIYGVDPATAGSLREGQGGALRMFRTADNRTLLPQSTDPNDGCNREIESARGRYCFASGDGRANENLHLTTMHLLWARQHNRVAAALVETNPSWGDEKIYQEARRIVGAQLQHIAYNEFVPIIIGEKEVDERRLRPLRSGFRPKNDTDEVDPSIANSFAAAAFRFAHTLLPGLMKVTDSQKATSSYVELHRMLFNPYSLYAKGGMESSLSSAASNSIQKTTTHVTSQLTKHLFEDPLSNITVPCGLDLVSLNIQRGRDHGLPGYNEWRRYCGLRKVESFAELAGELEPESLNEISKVYADVDDVDLYTGALAESDKADGLVGPTFRCIIGDQFSRIQRGDRFWYEAPGEPQSFTDAQLKEIRKTSLAKLICDCSDGIDHIQPEVMRSVGPENPMTSCEDIVGPDFSAWKDPSSPQILKAIPAADQPETWLNFKTTINNTVQEIVGFFSKAVPAPGSPDWTTFKDWVNKSFADIRSEVSSLHPKPLQSIQSSPIQPPAQTTKNEANNSQSLKDKKSFVNKAGKFDYMKFVMNRSLTDIDKYTKTATTQPTTYEDWIIFKADIKRYLNDALVNATGTPTAEQREELKKQIESEIDDIKSRIASLATTKLYLANEPREATTEDPAATADWLTLKKDVVKAITDAVDRIKAKAPPPGDPSWATFGLEIKNQFSSVKDHIPVLPTVKLEANDPSAAAYWDGFRDSLNRSISSAISGIGDGMPPPGDPAWAAFGAKIMKDFTQFRDKFEAKPKLKASETGNVPPFDWIKFKTDIIKSVTDTVSEIKKNMPPPGSPSWTAFRGQIMNGFAKIPSEVPSLKLNVVAAKSPETGTFDWMTLKKDITKSVSDIIDGDSATTDLPAGDPKWAAFGAKFAKFNRSFEVIKSEIDALRPKPEVAQFQLLTTDWTEFKTKINESLRNTLESMKSKPSATADPGWVSFRDSIKAEFDALKKEIATAKSEGSLMAARTPSESGSASSSAKEAFYFPELPVELLSLQAKTNKTLLKLKKSIVDMKLGATAPVISAADWIAFKQEFKDAVANFVSARNASETVEWTKMRDSVKKSFADLRDQIAAVRNSTVMLQKKSQVQDEKAIEALKEKKAKDMTKSGKFNSDKSGTIFDWEKLKTDINATIQNLLDDLGKIVPGQTPSKTLEESLVKAQSKFAKLQLSPSLTTQTALPDDWAVFVNGVNKTLNGVMKKIGALKPVDRMDSVALENYEKEVDEFFEEIKDVVEKKKSEFEAATSMASEILSKTSSRVLVTTTMIVSVWIVAAF